MSESYSPTVVMRDPRSLIPNPKPARIHKARKRVLLAAMFREYGIITPLFISPTNQVLAGNARLQAALDTGRTEVPCIIVSHLNAKQVRSFILADNRSAEIAEWDHLVLKEEFLAIEALAIDPDFDLSLTGFETAEIDRELGLTIYPVPDQVDRVEAIDRTKPSVTRLGQLWQLGLHRLLIGDAMNSASYEAVMRGEIAHQVVVDGPYNVEVDGHVGGGGRLRHAEFEMASGEMATGEFTEFNYTYLKYCISHSKDGAIIMAFMDWRHVAEMTAAANRLALELKNICVWVKTNGGMGSLYRSKHEFVFIFKSGKAPHTNNIELGRHGRNRTNVWEYAGANVFRKGRLADLATHPTVKPIALIMDAIKDCSNRGEIVLDPFGGSGTTLLAAERTGRLARLIEIDPYYADATIRRWQELTQQRAINTETKMTFDDSESANSVTFGDAA